MSTQATLCARILSEISNFTTSIYFLFPFFILLNLFTYTDRGIIPGASREFSTFAADAYDSTGFIQRNPDSGIGLLQAGFILGYSVAIVICGHLVHSVPWKRMTLMGFALWILAVFGSALSHRYQSYFMLLGARVLTGVSEASFQVIAPPMIQDRGGQRSGLWLSLFLSAMPLGMALGYVLGSQMANNHKLGWPWAFWLEGFIAIPVLFLGFLIRDDSNGGVFSPNGDKQTVEIDEITENDGQTAEVDESDDVTNRRLKCLNSSFVKEVKVCLSCKSLLALIAAQSICIAIFAVLTTFGGSFLLALGLFTSETEGASLFSSTAALAGFMGTPVGGIVVDKVLSKYRQSTDANSSDARISQMHNLRQLSSLLPVTTGIVAAGIIVCYPTLLFNRAEPFLIFLFCGFVFLFAAQSGITTCIMLSVPSTHRSNAIAFATLMAHAFGDVPSPIIFGYIKDKLAPACVINAKGDFLNPERCSMEHFGVRVTIGLAYAWITLSIFFFVLARLLSLREYRRLEIRSDCDPEERKALEMIEKKKIMEKSLFPVKKLDEDTKKKSEDEFEKIELSDCNEIL